MSDRERLLCELLSFDQPGVREPELCDRGCFAPDRVRELGQAAADLQRFRQVSQGDP